ncbi:MAG: DUF6171 family protein [Treponema sp.]|jgi:hypothetical protein|nr:DUF6171 family protein [Treponema sp.]
MEEPCPVCRNKEDLAAMQMTPELLEEMASEEKIADYCGKDEYERRINICKNCDKFISEMTCALCGCFVQFRARHLTAHCVRDRW